MMVQSIRKPVLDFTGHIKERTANFTGRTWVFQAINDWLADSNGSRFFLLTGEPGSGKTAIASQLSRFSAGAIPPPDGLVRLKPNFLSALHFCSARDSRWIDPRVFAESLATQLAVSHPVYAKALAEKSGERSIHIEVEQRVGQGQVVTGVFINKLDVGGATPEDAFGRVVREPLETLVTEELDGQVVILIDALDEALNSTFTPNIVALLSQTDNLPSRVRFILTSRSETDVLRPLRRSHPTELVLTSGQGLIKSLQDVQVYTQFALDRNPELENKLAPGLSRQTLINAIHKKSEGNFLYVKYLLIMLLEQQEQINLAQLDDLPTELDGIYLEFLERFVKSDAQSWENKYGPILGALAVAQIPLNEAQLSDFTGQSGLSTTIKRLRQLLDLDETLPFSQRTYAIYHRSFIDFLLDKDRSEEYGRDEKGEHLRLAQWCERGDLSIIWKDVEGSPGEQGRREYARKYYVTHLYLSREWQQPQKQRLFKALDTVQYGQAKIYDDPSMHSFARELDLGRQAAIWEGWTLDEGIALLPRLWQYTLLRCSLTSRADQYPVEAFHLLVLLGRKQDALGLAELLTDPAKKVEVLRCIAEQIRQQASEGTDWLDLLMKASDVARTIQDITQQAKALSGLGAALTQAQQWEQAESVINTIQDSFQQAKALSALGSALALAQQWKRASEVREMTERVIGTIQDNHWQAEALSDLGTALALAQQWVEAELVIGTIQDNHWQAEALSALGTALALAQHWAEAERVIDMIQGKSRRQAEVLSVLVTSMAQAHRWTEAERVIDLIQQSFDMTQQSLDAVHIRYDYAKALRELGAALAQAQLWEQASRAWERAEQVIDTIWLVPSRDLALRHLGLALARAQQFAEAERVINKILARSRHAKALSALSTVLARVEQWAEAERIINIIEFDAQQVKALSALGAALAQTQQWAEAERIINKITDSDEQSRAMSALGIALAQAQQWEQASRIWEQVKRVIGAIRMGPEHSEALGVLGRALAQAQPWAEAEQVIDKITDSNRQGEALSDLGAALAQVQQWNQAERVIGSITDSLQHAEALSALGSTLAQAQQWEQAFKVWECAERVIGTITDNVEQVKALSALGSALAKAQQWEQAFKAWEQAERVTNTITDRSRQVEPLSTLSIALAEAQQWAEAERVIGKVEYSYQQVEALSALGTALAQAHQWAEAERVIAAMNLRDEQVKALSMLGTALAQAQQWEQALKVWDQAKRIVGLLQGRSEYIGALSALSTALAQAQQWNQAEQVIGMLQVSDEQVIALSMLGTALAQAQRWEQASRAWEQAERIIGSIQFSNQASALSALGVALAQAHRWAEAERVIGLIQDRSEQAQALKGLSTFIAGANEFKQLLHIIQFAWCQIETRVEALTLFSIARTFISRKPEVGIAFSDAFTWVDTFLGG